MRNLDVLSQIVEAAFAKDAPEVQVKCVECGDPVMVPEFLARWGGLCDSCAEIAAESYTQEIIRGEVERAKAVGKKTCVGVPSFAMRQSHMLELKRNALAVHKRDAAEARPGSPAHKRATEAIAYLERDIARCEGKSISRRDAGVTKGYKQ